MLELFSLCNIFRFIFCTQFFSTDSIGGWFQLAEWVGCCNIRSLTLSRTKYFLYRNFFYIYPSLFIHSKGLELKAWAFVIFIIFVIWRSVKYLVYTYWVYV